MKKLLILLMALGFIVTACNNNKTAKNKNSDNREKDDYGKTDSRDNTDENKTSENSGSRGWPESERSAFLKECVASFDETQATLANQICPCVLGKMEKEISSYKEAETKGGEAASARIAMQCKEEIVGTSDNTGNTWSRSDENKFMEECEGEATKNVGAVRANQYCDCMLQKIKKIFSSLDETNRKLATIPQAELTSMTDECNGK